MSVAFHRRKIGVTERRKSSCPHLLASAVLLAIGGPAFADNISTLPQWNGNNAVAAWGFPDTATYGETITPTASQTHLSSFTFELDQLAGTSPQFQAFIYRWTGSQITGSALFASPVLTAPSSGAFTAVTVNTGNVTLTAGQQYVLFFTTSSVTQASAGLYKFGVTPLSAYAGGQFVFQNNGNNFSTLNTVGWGTAGEDLAFSATMFGLINPLLPSGAPINPTNVAAGIDKASNAGATLPAGFNNLFSLTPSQLVSALGALSGENATQAQEGAFQLVDSYLSLLTDPYSINRASVAGADTGGAMGFAPEQPSKLPPSADSVYAMYPKASMGTYDPRWEVWGASFGGSNSTRGDLTGLGSHDSSTSVGAVAAGADYRFSPNSLIGFSLAGGGTNWSVAGNGGGGHSDAFMAAVYSKYNSGPLYLSGALTFANYWMSTSRTVNVAGLDQLNASFNAQSWGGRLESGYRLPGQLWLTNWMPYGAIQAQSFHSPVYTEAAATGSNEFALNFSDQTATTYRAEVGLRADRLLTIDSNSQISFFGKVGYAHDEFTTPSASANFTALGTGAAPFIVYGAMPSHDLALTTAGAEWRFSHGWSFLAKFDGEFGDRSQTYSGTGRLRYTW